MKCLDEGVLQAYLDTELPEAQMRRAAGHLEACATCRDRLGRREATEGRVNAWLDALAPQDLPADVVVRGAVPRVAARTAGLRWRWAVVLAGALAASVALFFVNAPAPKKEAAVQKPQAPPVVYRAATVRERFPPRAVKPARVHRPKPLPVLDDFVPFDDADPIQIGMVVRVMLPVSDASEIAADLMIGEDGRARAFRLVQ